MSLDDRLDSYYQERTLDIIKRKTFMAKIGDTEEPAEWHTKATQAILTDLLEIIATTTKGYPELDYLQKEIWKDAQMKLRAELRDKVRKYCE